MKSFLGVPILVRGKPYGNLYLTEKEGGDEFDEQDEEAVVVLADWAAIAIENARGYSILEARREELERLVSTFDASSEIAHALAGGTDLDRILELVVKRGRALTDARSMLVLLEQGDELVVAALAGELDDSLVGAHDSHRRDCRRPAFFVPVPPSVSPMFPDGFGSRLPSRRTRRAVSSSRFASAAARWACWRRSTACATAPASAPGTSRC